MATRANLSAWQSKRVLRTLWSGLLNGDDGSAESTSRLSDKTVQVNGTFGAGGSVTIQGSNDGINWFTLTEADGTTPATYTAAALAQLLENPLYVRPLVTAGDGTTSLTVTLLSASTA